MKLITGAVALATALTFALAPAAAADAPDGKGVPHSDEQKGTGKPANPRGFGSITSQLARNEHGVGSHVRDQPTPHLGVGNVARNDAGMAAELGTNNTGSRVPDHADTVGPAFGYDPTVRPGTKEAEETATAKSTDTSAPAALAAPAADDLNNRLPAGGEEKAIAPSIDTSVPAAQAAPAADDPSFSLGPLGTFSYSLDGISLTDYSYLYGLSGGPVEFSVQSQGTDAGLTSSSAASAGGFSTSLDSAYGTSYEGSSCVLCQENTTSFGDLVQTTEFDVLADGTVELEGSGPFGSYSWPPQ